MRRHFPLSHSFRRLTYALRRLGILSQTEYSLWISFSAFFRADPCLQLLGGLEQDLRQSVQRMTVRVCTKSLESPLYIPQEVRETRLIILSTCNARQADAALPTTADMSNPQPCEASAALQPAESGSRAFSSGHSTTIEPMGTDTSNLRRRVTSPHVALVNVDVNLQKLEEIIKASTWLRNNELEPCIGDPDCPAEADPHGIRGLSVYTAFVKRQNGDAYGCKYARCSAYSVRCMEEAVRHQRIHHFDHSPYLCLASTWNAWYISVFHIPRALFRN